MVGSGLSPFLSRFLVEICVQVVVMHVFWSVFTSCILVPASVVNVVPAGFTLVSEQYVRTVVPSQPSPHFLGEVPNLVVWLLVDPMSHWSM